MSKMPVVFDIETKHTFREFSDHKKLGVSLATAYDYATGKGYSYLEHEMSQMFQLFEQASCVIGYNIIGFDLPVLQAYYPGDIMQFPAFDILDDIRETLGRRLALNDVVAATLGKKKSGNGLQAIEYFREGKIEELRQYCLDDTMLTKQLFDYGVENNEIYYMSERGKTPIRVRWKKHMDRPASEATHLILPF